MGESKQNFIKMKWVILCLLVFILTALSLVALLETESRRANSGSSCGSWGWRRNVQDCQGSKIERNMEVDVDVVPKSPSCTISDKTFAALCELCFVIMFLLALLTFFLAFREGIVGKSPTPPLIKRDRLPNPDVLLNQYSTFACYQV